MRQVFLLICLGFIGSYFYNKLHPPILEYCKFALVQSLRSPSTLDIISTDVDTVYKKKAAITYDAANAYGAPVRSIIKCELGNGHIKKLASITMDGEEISELALFEVNAALYKKNNNYQQ